MRYIVRFFSYYDLRYLEKIGMACHPKNELQLELEEYQKSVKFSLNYCSLTKQHKIRVFIFPVSNLKWCIIFQAFKFSTAGNSHIRFDLIGPKSMRLQTHKCFQLIQVTRKWGYLAVVLILTFCQNQGEEYKLNPVWHGTGHFYLCLC